jgi:hypothetical protein
VRSADLMSRIGEMYEKHPVYPINFTFDESHKSTLKKLKVFSFIRRVQTIVLDGVVIEAKISTDILNGASQWNIEMYDPNICTWNQPTSLRELLHSDTVTAVETLRLHKATAQLVVELSWSVSQGDMNWTATRTSCLHAVLREGISAQEILLHQKLRHIQTFNLIESDRSVLVNVSVLNNLKNLQSIDLSVTNVVDLSALA